MKATLRTLADSPAGPAQRWAAWSVAGLFVLATAALLPWARLPLPPAPGFIPIYQTALIVIYALSAHLLVSQFRRSRTRPLLILGAGFAVTAAILVMQLLSFPAMLAPGRLFGGPDTTIWLWTFWHLAPPLFSIGYVWAEWRGSDLALTPRQTRRAIGSAVGASLVAIGLIGMASGPWVHLLPKSVEGDVYGSYLLANGIGPGLVVLTIAAALLAAWRWRRGGTMLRLWLVVSLVLLGCDNVLTLAGMSRGSLGWYAGRMEALLAGAVVLAVYLRAIDSLYGQAEDAVESREQALGALRAAADGLDLALDGAGMGEWELEPQSGRWISGQRLDRLLGYGDARPDWTLAAVLDRVLPADREKAAQAFAAGRAGQIAFECGLTRADGQQRWMAVLGRPDRAGDQAHPRIRGVFMDVTERRLADERLEQAHRMEAIGQLTGGVAHDFNNLLTVVIGSLDMILRMPSNAARVERLGRSAMEAARRGSRLTGQLLSFSRRQLLRPEHVNPNRLVSESEDLIQRTLGDGVTLRLELEPTIDPALIDRGGLETALLNLAANARDALGGHGRLTIRTENVALDTERLATLSEGRHDGAPGDYIVITVSDDGPGMPAEVALRAFDPFFTTKDIGKGTGLGLSQVYGFARQSGGFVRLRTAGGEGTSVAIHLPRSVASSPAAASPAASNPIAASPITLSPITVGPITVGLGAAADMAQALPLRAANAGEVVLVVDDDETVRRLAAESLGELGYRTLEAEDAAAALLMLREPGRVDVLFSDVVMPGGMNGAQLAVEARRLRPDLKILLTSGYAASALAEEHGARTDMEILRKPYLREELASKIKLVAGGRG